MIKRIRKIVEENTPLKDLSKRGKLKGAPIYRGMFMKLARKHTTANVQTIADEIGYNHASVLYWNNNLEDAIRFNENMKALYKRLDALCGSQDLVVIESPYSGDVEKNVDYARQCLLDSLNKGEYPIASHLLYTQVLKDTNKKQRKLGIDAGLKWGKLADRTIVYTDLGISSGMEYGIQDAKKNNREIIYRKILTTTDN